MMELSSTFSKTAAIIMQVNIKENLFLSEENGRFNF